LTGQRKAFENAFEAVKSGDVNLVRRMISEDKSLLDKVTEIKGRSLLIYAVIEQHLLVVKLLVELGANQSVRDRDGRNVWDYANEERSKLGKLKNQLSHEIRGLLTHP